MPNIKLQSSDGEVFDVDVEITKVSNTITTMLDDLGIDVGNEDQNALPLPSISSDTLKRVIEWATFHRDDPPIIEDDEDLEEYEWGHKRTDNIKEWDLNFLKVDAKTLFELIRAADFLQIKPLVDAGCKTVANMIKGKTPEEIRETFKINEIMAARKAREATTPASPSTSSSESTSHPEPPANPPGPSA